MSVDSSLFYFRLFNNSRACLRNHFCNLHAPICGRFYLNEGGVAGYVNWMKAKYTANWGVQIAGMIFQTRSSYLNFDEIA